MPLHYILFYKPYGVHCTFTDPEGRPTLKDYVPVPEVYAAGRLDHDSEGLLLLTNDGALNHRLTDPRFEHPKTYYAQVEGVATETQVKQLCAGVVLRGERTRPAEVAIIPPPAVPPRAVRAYHPTTWLRVILREGKKHQLRRMTAAVGLPCLRLVRVGIGSLTVEGLQPGAWRKLTKTELEHLGRITTFSNSGS